MLTNDSGHQRGAVAAHESATDLMDITSLAKAVQAEVVIYISVDSFSLTPDGQTYSPEAHFHVKVIDITKPEARSAPRSTRHAVAVTSKATSTANPKTAEQISSLTSARILMGVEKLSNGHARAFPKGRERTDLLAGGLWVGGTGGLRRHRHGMPLVLLGPDPPRPVMSMTLTKRYFGRVGSPVRGWAENESTLLM